MVSNLREFLKSERLSFVLRILLAVTILAATIPKLTDIEKYSVYLVYSYRVFPVHPINIARFLGLVAPYLELLIGLGLLFGVLTRLCAAGWGMLSLVYLITKLHIIFVQGRIIPCGCFPRLLPEMLVAQSIWIDMITMLFCVQIITANREKRFFSLWALLPVRWQQGKLRYLW